MYLNGSPPRKKTLGGSMITSTIKDGLSKNKTIIKPPLKSTMSLAIAAAAAASSTTNTNSTLLYTQGSLSASISSNISSSPSSTSSISSAASSSSSSSSASSSSSTSISTAALIGNQHRDSHLHQHSYPHSHHLGHQQNPYSHSRNIINGSNHTNTTTTTAGGNSGSSNIHNSSYGIHTTQTSANTNTNILNKRSKRNSWGARERAGMSFLIVIAFFAVFGLIIITELFMIDDKNHGGIVVLRHGNLNSRLGDSMPDYDNIKEDYDMLDSNLMMADNNRIFQYRGDNKLKIHDRLSVGVGVPIALDSNNNHNNQNNHNNHNNNGFHNNNNKNNNNNENTNRIHLETNNGNLAAIPWGQKLDMNIEQTLPHYPIGVQPTDGSWQVVNGTRFKFFIYSAYYDRRDGKMVRVIGATKTRGPEKVWCRFWYPLNDPKTHNHTKYYSATVMARVKIIRENWNLKYSACFILCPLRAPGLNIPYSISIVSRLRAPPGNVILLRNTDQDIDFLNLTSATTIPIPLSINQKIPNKMAICVKPFHFNYDQALYLMEYLELNSLLGISHFTFYNHTLGPHSTCVLQHYINGNIPNNLTILNDDYDSIDDNNHTFDSTLTQHSDIDLFNKNSNNTNSSTNTNHNSYSYNMKNSNMKHKYYTEYTYTKPTVNILPWDLRMRSQKEIRTEGLFAALNDCLYRNMYRYKYLALVDLDEFIMPRHNDTLTDLLSWLNSRYTNRNAGSYSFQNAFFYLQFADDSLLYETTSMNPALRASLITQRKTKRRSKLHPQKQRSKYICKPESVVEAGNHFVWEFIPGKGSLNVPTDAGILHHYRVCEFGGDDCIKSPSIIDRTATKYMKRLLARVDNVYNYLKKPCNLENLPPPPTSPPPTSKRVLRIRNRNNTLIPSTTTTLPTSTKTTNNHKLYQNSNLLNFFNNNHKKIKVKIVH